MIIVIFALLFMSELANAYGRNQCRAFSEDQLVKDFNLDDFSGEWFPLFMSRDSRILLERCPVMYFERRQAKHSTQAKRLQKYSETMDPFVMRTSYKGMAGIVDNLRKYKGYFDKGSSNGSLWVGATLRPLRKFQNNFQVVSTDYDSYAILYYCTYETAMYNKDLIIVLTRQSPAFEHLDPELITKIRSEFERIFGEEEESEEQEPAPEANFLKEEGGEESGGDQVEGPEAGTGKTFRSSEKKKQPGKPLIFDEHLKPLDHESCSKDDSYPDLSLTLVQRNKLREQRLREERRSNRK